MIGLGKYKVCVYAICKNEAKFARRWMESMREADWVCALDTGSTDGTPELLERLGAIVAEKTIYKRAGEVVAREER